MRTTGERTLLFNSEPRLISSAAIVSKVENDGPLSGKFDVVMGDDRMGEESFEKAELRMFENAVRLACLKAGTDKCKLGCLLAGDLLNQIITANYGARNLAMPFLGLYGACSTMSESLLIASVLVDGGYRRSAACVACSHFSTAERQYRFPLELGMTAPPTAQRTVTGAGCMILSDETLETAPYSHIAVTAATIGKSIDYGITDANNMGAAMAPAAADTITAHLRDMDEDTSDYDHIITGDLGKFGTEMLHSLLNERKIDLSGRHLDCGCMVYHPEQGYDCGGSGCGCSAVVMSSHILPMIESGAMKRALFLATGALMSPTSSMQGESIPAIAHAVVLEHRR